MPNRVKSVPRLEEKQFASELGEQTRSAEATAPLGKNFEEDATHMGKAGDVKREGRLMRWALGALLIVTMAAATLQVGAGAAQAGQSSLSWTAPTTNTDGTPLTDLAGYKLHIGNATRSYQQHIDVGTPPTTWQAT